MLQALRPLLGIKDSESLTKINPPSPVRVSITWDFKLIQCRYGGEGYQKVTSNSDKTLLRQSSKEKSQSREQSSRKVAKSRAKLAKSRKFITYEYRMDYLLKVKPSGIRAYVITAL